MAKCGEESEKMEVNLRRKSDPPAEPKKKHRPPEPDIALLPKEITALGVLASSENENFISAKSPIHIKRRKSKDEMMMGRLVNGVVDGMFDAGYLVSVRIGESDTVFRGAVFRPGLIIPPSFKMNHVAPNEEHAPSDHPHHNSVGQIQSSYGVSGLRNSGEVVIKQEDLTMA